MFRSILIVIVALAQFAQRQPLTPAETLLAPDLLRTIERASVEGKAPAVIAGSDRSAGEIVLGVPTTAIVPPKDATGLDRASFIAAASAYFLATLPNAGSEALLSHVIVGAHARLAEDGRRAVALMGSQQRASGEVLMMFAQAIEREQRRIR